MLRLVAEGIAGLGQDSWRKRSSAASCLDELLAIGRGAVYEIPSDGHRYSDLSQLDDTFCRRVECGTDLLGNFDQAQSSVIQTDGMVVVVGFSGDDTRLSFALARYLGS